MSDARRDLFNTLYRRHSGELKRFISKTFGAPPPEPDDIVQGIFSQLMMRDDLDTISNLRAFLFRSASNLVLDTRRSAKVRLRLVESGEAKNLFPVVEELHPEHVLGAKERLAIVERAIQALPPLEREVVILNRYHEMSYADIARRTRRTEAQIRRWVLSSLMKCEAALKAAEAIGSADHV
ncbi:MAG TPA: RNA polymerase sigma factor [Verrucomicrobiae bacterium]|nr:RNA polymerase sigma factor [Verrucomicrobiae bacterium]